MCTCCFFLRGCVNSVFKQAHIEFRNLSVISLVVLCNYSHMFVPPILQKYFLDADDGSEDDKENDLGHVGDDLTAQRSVLVQAC